jgi:hypothetical protein
MHDARANGIWRSFDRSFKCRCHCTKTPIERIAHDANSMPSSKAEHPAELCSALKINIRQLIPHFKSMEWASGDLRILAALPHYSSVARYRLTRPLVAFEVRERRAFTIPAGSVIEKDNFTPVVGVTAIYWAGGTVTVGVLDLLECIRSTGLD